MYLLLEADPMGSELARPTKGGQEFSGHEDEEKQVTWNQMTEAVLMQMQHV